MKLLAFHGKKLYSDRAKNNADLQTKKRITFQGGSENTESKPFSNLDKKYNDLKEGENAVSKDLSKVEKYRNSKFVSTGYRGFLYDRVNDPDMKHIVGSSGDKEKYIKMPEIIKGLDNKLKEAQLKTNKVRMQNLFRWNKAFLESANADQKKVIRNGIPPEVFAKLGIALKILPK